MTVVRLAAKSVFAVADLVLPRLKGPRILIYHQVGSGRTHEMNVTTKAFRRQLDWMQSHGEIVSLEDGLKRRGEPEADRLFVLTFDDGYEDVFVNAFPILKARDLPFTLYLTSGPIESPDGFPSWPGEPLSWAQVREMVDSGLVTMGAHTHTHPDLRTVNEETAAQELDRSNALIAERSGMLPRHFTYPKGWWAKEAHNAVCSRYASATLGTASSMDDLTDVYKIPRLPVQMSDAWPLFGRKLKAGARVEDWLRRRIHGYDGP